MGIIVPGQPPDHIDADLLGPDGEPLVRVMSTKPVGPMRFQSLDEDGQPVGDVFEVPVKRISWTMEP